MARIAKPKFYIKERNSEKFGVIYDVYNRKNELVKTFIEEGFANRFINMQILEYDFNKALKKKPVGVSSDLKKEFGDSVLV